MSRAFAHGLAELLPELRGDLLYNQVPALSTGDRGMLDLLTLDRNGRLVVLELKADEDLHLPLQALDYWIRVRALNADRQPAPAGRRAALGLRAQRLLSRRRSFAAPAAPDPRRARPCASIPPTSRCCATSRRRSSGNSSPSPSTGAANSKSSSASAAAFHEQQT